MKAIVLFLLAAISHAEPPRFIHHKFVSPGTFQYSQIHRGMPSGIIALELRLVRPSSVLDKEANPIHIVDGPQGIAIACPTHRLDVIYKESMVAFVPNWPSWDIDYHKPVTAPTADIIQSHAINGRADRVYEIIRAIVSAPRGWR